MYSGIIKLENYIDFILLHQGPEFNTGSSTLDPNPEKNSGSETLKLLHQRVIRKNSHLFLVKDFPVEELTPKLSLCKYSGTINRFQVYNERNI